MRQIESSWLKVDWRIELQQIEPFLSDRGGIVYLVGYPSSACNTFVKLVRNEIEATEGNVCVRIDPQDPTTRTPIEIVSKLEARLGIDTTSIQELRVASNIQAGRDVRISNVDVNYELSPFERSEELLLRTRGIIAEIGNRVRNSKVAAVLDNWHKNDVMPVGTRRWFWDSLWYGELETLADEGFLLLCVCETDGGDPRFSDPAPRPNALITLSPCYTGESRNQAVDDVAKLLMSLTNEPYAVAHARADSLLIEWSDQPDKLHGGLPSQRLGLQSRQ